jgi:small-conductance mechanosensitive channel
MRAAAALAVCALAAASAFAQLPGPATGKAAAPASQATPATPAKATQDTADADTRAAIRKAQAAALAQLATIEAEIGTPQEAPPGIAPKEIAERATLARQLVGVYQQQQDALDRADAARARQREIEQASAQWRGFDTPPPYSVLRVDAVRDDLEAAEVQIAQADSRRALFERIQAQFAAKMKTSQSAARLAAENADGARGTPQAAALDWARQFTALRATVDSETQAVLQMATRTAREEAAAAAAARDFARRKLEVVGANLALPAEDLARVQSDLEARRRALEREVSRAARVSATALEERTRAEQKAAAARAAPGANDEPAAERAKRLADLDADAAIAREAAATAAQRLDLLRESMLMLDGERATWEARAEAMRGGNPVMARAAYEKLTTSLAGVRALMQYLEEQLNAVRSRISDADAKSRGPITAESQQAQRLLEVLRRRESDLRSAIESGQPIERLLARFRADVEGRRDVSVTERVKDAIAGTVLEIRDVWTYELFAVDDTLETADGRKVAVSRSVTIGKTFGALLIVVFGYWLCSFIARRIERGIVARGRAAPQSARLLRKWAMFMVSALLAIFALASANIPLAAFTFLGGALAIAAGFGLQNLLKNFVSGIMLLVERPVRLGDLVEVDGNRGRITEIGIRASTIRTADGIESMIPNSRFVEGNVTNWTYTSPQTRQTITLGVAYGTPLRKAADVLQGVLERHGQVLKTPAPQVYLDAYEDSAISFLLTYWIEMLPDNDSRRVKSDLLHMIDRGFAEAGIVIPFPQRDVRLDIDKPVPVAIVGKAGE